MNSSHLSPGGNDTPALQDAFAVLFFVSVGMLFDPVILLREPLAVLATLFVIVIGKSVAASPSCGSFWLQPAHGADHLRQPGPGGEFSFILMGLGSCSSWSRSRP